MAEQNITVQGSNFNLQIMKTQPSANEANTNTQLEIKKSD